MQPGRQEVSGFDPRGIPGCFLWLDAADSTTVTVTSGNVSQWRDKSSNAYTFSNTALTGRRGPTYVTTQNGRNVLTFTASSLTDATGQFLELRQPTTRWSFSNITIFSAYRPALTNAVGWGDINVFSVYDSSASSLYTLPAVSNTDSSLNYGVVLVSSYGQTNLRSSNGTKQTSEIGGGTLPSFFDTSSVVIGSRRTGASVSNAFFVGNIAEILVYTGPLSSADHRLVEGYLSWKWGVQSSLESTHPYRTAAPALYPFRPVDIPECTIWFDAADTRTLTLSGTQVTSWQNKGLLASVTATNTTAAPLVNAPGTVTSGYTFSTSPLNTLQFPATSYLAVSNVVTTTPSRTLFYVFTVTSFGDGYSRIFASSTFSGNRQANFNAWNRDGNTLNLYPVGFVASEYLGAAGRAPYSGVLPYTGTPFVIGFRHSAAPILPALSVCGDAVATLSNRISINGLSVSPTATQRLVNGYYVGTDTFILGTGPGYSNVQQVGEVIQYDRPLTDLEMREVEGYLCQKWGVSVADVSHPYLTFAPTNSRRFTPNAVVGPALWLDAADVTTLTFSGSSVTNWADKSASRANITFTSSPTTTIATESGNNVLVFAGAYGSNAGFRINAADHTLVAVHKPSAASSNTSLFRFQTGTANPYVIFPYYSASTARGWVTSEDGATLSNTGAGLPEGSSTSAYTMVLASIANGTQEVFSNGTRVASNTQALNTSNMPFLTLGATSTGTEPYGGTVGELLVFNSRIGTQQRYALEGYLASKWKIPLPSNHPYLVASPAVTPYRGGIVTRGLVAHVDPNSYTASLGTGAVLPGLVGRTWFVNGTRAIATTTGGGNVMDVSRTALRYIYDTSTYAVSNTGYTVDFWVRFLDISANTTPIFVESSNASFGTITQSGILNIHVAGTNYLRFVSSISNSDFIAWGCNTWLNFCYTKLFGSVNLYANGGLASARINQNAPQSALSFFSFGATSNTPIRVQYGPLKIYNVVLDASEVRQNFRAVAPFMGVPLDTSSIG